MNTFDTQSLSLFFEKALTMAKAAQEHAHRLELRVYEFPLDEKLRQIRRIHCIAGTYDAWAEIEDCLTKTWEYWDEQDADGWEVKDFLRTELRWGMGMTAADLALAPRTNPRLYHISLAIQQAFYRYVVEHWPI